MSRYFTLFICWLLLALSSSAQLNFEQKFNALPQLQLDSGVTLTFDEPDNIKKKPTKVIIYALPNGNTTAQTFGKKLARGDDWHFDIQHIGAQTAFIRQTDTLNNYIVVYAANQLKSWPAWRRTVKNSDDIIEKLVQSIYAKYENLSPKLTLSGHSGGGSFIFGYLNTKVQLPFFIERLGFLDATYGYETEKHQAKLQNWLKAKHSSLQVIAYNDSVVVDQGKPLVSPTGGTWYRSKLMAKDVESLQYADRDDCLIWQNKKANASFILLKNPAAKIFHTVLVEKNGFIHLIFNGTRYQSKNYQFWNTRAYENRILE